MPLSDLWHLLGRRRDCDRTSVSFTRLLWKKPGGFRWFFSKEQEPRGASGFLLGEDETWRLRDIFPRIVILTEVEGSLLYNAYQHACVMGK